MNNLSSEITKINSPLFNDTEISVEIRKEAGDQGILRQIFYDGEIDLRKTKFWVDIKYKEENLNGKALIVDCGAHIGLATLFFNLLFPKSQIESYEPDYENYSLAYRNNFNNKNVRIRNLAVSSTNENIYLNNNPENSSAFNVKRECEDNHTRIISSTTINDILKNRSDLIPLLIKIDIEGWEKDLFSSNTEWINKFDYIVIELHDWLFPGKEISQNFWKTIKLYDFDIDSIGEHLVIKTHSNNTINSKSISDLMQKIYHSNSKLASWYTELQKRPLSQKIDTLNSLNQQLKKDIENLGRKYTSTMIELESTRSENIRYRSELDAIYACRSWRVTAPLRNTRKHLRRLKIITRKIINSKQEIYLKSQYKDSTSPQTLLERQLEKSEKIQPADNTETKHKPLTTSQENSPCFNSKESKNNKKLLIITPDFHGPIRNGGIGTAFTNLARTASLNGMNVCVLYTLGEHSEDKDINYWVEYYNSINIELIPLVDSILPKKIVIDAPWFRQSSWKVHQWLEHNQNNFDVVIFPEWMGLAYYVLLAKKQSLAYLNLSIIVNTHSPEAWAMEGNRRLPESPDDIDRDFMERECVRMADAVISPSTYMLNWMNSHKWNIPNNSHVIPNIFQHSEISKGINLEQVPIRLVFFGRLEFRKGLKLFCDAIERIPEELRKNIIEIVFLGKNIDTHGFNSIDYIKLRTKNLKLRISVLTDKNSDQALLELRNKNTLAIIPSLVENSPYTVLECLFSGISFLASSVGGIPEMIKEKYKATHLFEPNPESLAKCIQAALQNGLALAEPAWQADEVVLQWLQFINKNYQKNNAIANISKALPLVSVCLIHYNRHHLLSQAIDSLRVQTYSRFEVILVDDGSPSVSAQRYLQALEIDFAARGWKIIHQSNSFLGAARNRAAAEASGKYLLFMDDDNIAEPEMLQKFVTSAMQTDADVLTCVAMPFTGNKPPEKPEFLWLPLGGAAGAGLYRNAYGDANALWKKQAFEKLGGYTTDYGVGHEDWELFADAVLSGLRLELVPQPLYWYRVNPSGMLRSGDHWADHARSVRPYLRHDPQGLGMALAYALLLERKHYLASTATHEHTKKSRWAAIMRVLYLAKSQTLRAQFFGALRSQGFGFALRKALKKARSL